MEFMEQLRQTKAWRLAKDAAVWIIPLVLISFSARYLHQISQQTVQDDLHTLIHRVAWWRIGASILLTATSFALLVLLEIIGFYSSATIFQLRTVAKSSLIAFSVSNTLSIAGLAGASLRMRLYGREKIPISTIARVTAFASGGVWLGFLVLIGFAFTFNPIQIPAELHVSAFQLQIAGSLSLITVLVYLLVAWAQKPALTLRGEKLSVPKLRFAAAQVFISMVDWVASASVLYVLMPELPSVTFAQFLTVFLLAQIVGNVSHVPGGLGILEVFTIYALAPGRALTPDLVASLVLFRFIYYVGPLILGLVMLAVEEIVESTHLAAILIRHLLRLTSSWVPRIAAGAITVVGALLILETHLDAGRAIASTMTPGWSPFAISTAGMIMLVLADGIRRRSLSAWFLAIPATFTACIYLIVVDATLWSISYTVIVLSLLIFCKSEFFRKSRLFDETLSPRWATLLISCGLGLIWIYYALGVDLGVAQHPWWDNLGISSNFVLATTVTPATAIVLFALWRLITPNGKPSKQIPYVPLSLAQVGPIAKSSPVTQSQLALLGDKDIFPSQERDGFIMFATEGSTWVSLGDPVAPEVRIPSLVCDFRKFVDKQGGTPVFYQVQPEKIRYYIDSGFQLIKIGEEARLRLSDFSLDGRNRKSLRNTCSRMEKEGVTFEIIKRTDMGPHWATLQKISDSWLTRNNVKEKGFSLGYFEKMYLGHFDFAVLKTKGEICAFANIWRSEKREELSIDLMRTNAHSPSGSMEFLFIQLMLMGKAEGYGWFNLGMAPLSGLDGTESSLSWNQFGSMLFETGENLYNFQGVRSFKDKFEPTWEPRYLAYTHSLTGALADLARLISRGNHSTRRSA